MKIVSILIYLFFILEPKSSFADEVCSEIVNNLLATAQLPKIGETNSKFQVRVNTGDFSKAKEDPPQLNVTAIEADKTKSWEISVGQWITKSDNPKFGPGMFINVWRHGSTVGSRFPEKDGRAFDYEATSVALNVVGFDGKGRKICRIDPHVRLSQTLGTSKNKTDKEDLVLSDSKCKETLESAKFNANLQKQDKQAGTLKKLYDKFQYKNEKEVDQSFWVCNVLFPAFGSGKATVGQVKVQTGGQTTLRADP